MQKFYNCILILALAILIFPSCGKEEEGVLLKKSEVEENFNQLINGDDKAHYEAINFFKSQRPESVFLYIQRPHQQGGKQERLPLSTLLGLDPNTYRKQPIYYFDCSVDQQGIVDLQIIEYLPFDYVTQLFEKYKAKPYLQIQEVLRSTFSDDAKISFNNDHHSLILEDYYIKLQQKSENAYPVSSYGNGQFNTSFKLNEIIMKYVKNPLPVIPPRRASENILPVGPELVSIDKVLTGPVVPPPTIPNPEKESVNPAIEPTTTLSKDQIIRELESKLNMIRLHGNRERILNPEQIAEIKNEILLLCLNNAIEVLDTPQDSLDISEGEESPTIYSLIQTLQVQKSTKNSMLPSISISNLRLNQNNKVTSFKFNYQKNKN